MESTHYIWRSVRDDRSRGEHAKRHGQVFSWDNPPEDGHPGEAPNCRCWAEPIPIVEEQFQQVSDMPIIESKHKWTFDDFAYHYIFGKGRTVSLSEIGLLSDVIKIAERDIYHKVEAQIKDEAIKIQNGVLKDYFRNSYSFFDAAYALRRSVLTGSIQGSVQKGDDGIHINAIIEYKLTNDITDPLSLREEIKGTSDRKYADPITEVGGTAFYVSGYWRTKLTGLIPHGKAPD